MKEQISNLISIGKWYLVIGNLVILEINPGYKQYGKILIPSPEFYWFLELIPNFKCPSCGSRLTQNINFRFPNFDYFCHGCARMGRVEDTTGAYTFDLAKAVEKDCKINGKK